MPEPTKAPDPTDAPDPTEAPEALEPSVVEIEQLPMDLMMAPMMETVTVPVTISVITSSGAPIEGVAINGQYQSGSIYAAGSTDAGGELALSLKPGEYKFTAMYRSTSQSKTITVNDGDASGSVSFQTTEARVQVVDTEGNKLKAAQISYKGSSTQYLGGPSDEDGIATLELFPGTYPMKASYLGTQSAFKDVDITGTGVDGTFTATALKLTFPGQIRYKSEYTYYYNKPVTAFFPGTYTFYFRGPTGAEVAQDITIGTNTLSPNFICASLKSSTGAGLPGGKISYYAGGWMSNAGTTNGNGLALIEIPAGKVVTSVSVSYKGGTKQIDHNMADPYYNFQTTRVNVSLLNSQNNPLPNGTASYYGGAWLPFGDGGSANSSMEMLPAVYSFAVAYAGGTQQKSNINVGNTPDVVFTTTRVEVKLLDSKGNPLPGGGAQYYGGSWRNFGDENPGTANNTMEMLPVTYSFRASYGGTSQQLDGVDVSKNPVVVFQTGAITLRYTGNISYYTNGWKNYTGPIELLPVSTLFKFTTGKSGFANQDLHITPTPGASYDRTVAYVRLVSSSGAGIAGGQVRFYDGGWANLGVTDQSGTFFGLLEGNKAKSISFGMTLGGGYVQKTQNLASDSHVLFQTQKVELRLISSEGDLLEGDGRYYAGSWQPFSGGKTNAFMEMLPTSYSFGVTYLGGYIQKTQNVSIDPVVVFQTVPVTFTLLNSAGDALEGQATYYANGWKTFADGKTSRVMEMLPTSYSFGVTYLGGYNQKTQDVSVNPDVVFRTVQVAFRLLNSWDRKLEGEASYYAGGWKPFGNGDANTTMEMLPAKYTFGVKYLGASIQKQQTVEQGSTVLFRTTPVAVSLYIPIKVFGSVVKIPIGVRGEGSFYAGQWRAMNPASILPAVKELLPTSYSFAVSYAGHRQQKAQDISKDPFVSFATTWDEVRDILLWQ